MNNDISSPYTSPKGWAWTRVGEVYDIVGGGTPSTAIPEYWEGDIPWITSADIFGLKDIRPRRQITRQAIDNSATNLVPAGSLIVVTRVGLGKIALTKTAMCFSQDSQALVARKASPYPDYSLYCFSEAVQVFKYKHRGTTINGVTKKQLAELPFAVPPLPEQHRIVAKIEELFTRLDVGVEALKRIKAQLKRYRQAVLKYAFEGKLTAEWREAHKHELEPASVLLERIKQERQMTAKGKYKELPPLDTSDLPELPEGWVWTGVGEIGHILAGYGFPRKLQGRTTGDLPFFKVADISNAFLRGHILLGCAMNYISAQVCKEIRATPLREGTIVFAKIGEAIKLNRRAILAQDSLVDNNVAGIHFSAGINNLFAFYVLLTLRLEEYSRATTVPSVRKSDLECIPFPVPPLPEQHRIVEEIEHRLSVADQVETTVDYGLKQAERLRQSILKRAFEGKLVPQDPNDEPAEKLLERLKEERAKQQTAAKSVEAVKKKVTTGEMRLM